MRRKEASPRDIYINEYFAPEDPYLFRIRRALREDGKEGINVGAYEGRLLQFLLQSVQAKKVVEVGLLYGYSTLWMARALPPGGKIYSLEVEQKNFDMARELLKPTLEWPKIELIHGEAKETLPQLSSQGPFDVVFIDADKLSYLHYLDWAEKNVRKGGLIIGDNTFLFGQVYLDSADGGEYGPDGIQIINKFNKRLSDPQKYTSVLMPTNEGMTVALKK